MSRPNLTTNIHNSSGHAEGAARIQLADAINDRSHSTILLVLPEALPKFHSQTQLMTSLVPIRPRTIRIHRVTPEALPKFHHVNAINDTSRSNSSTNIHDSAGYAGGAA